MSWYWEDYQDVVCEFFATKKHVARKQHVCGECHCRIHPGVTYLCYVGKWDGEFSMFIMCSNCCETWVTVLDIFDEYEVPALQVFGLLRGAIEELLDATFIDEDDQLVHMWLPDVQEITDMNPAQMSLFEA